MKKSNCIYKYVVFFTFLVLICQYSTNFLPFYSINPTKIPNSSDYVSVNPITISGNIELETYFTTHPEVLGDYELKEMSGNNTHPYIFDNISIDAGLDDHSIELTSITHHIIIQNSKFYDSSGEAWYGLDITSCANILIQNCTFENISRNNACAFNSYLTSNFSIVENQFSDCDSGINIESSNSFEIINNSFQYCEDGIYMGSSDQAEIRENVVEDSSGYPLIMEDITGIANISIKENYFIDFLGYFLFNTIENCSITHNHFVNFTWNNEYVMNLYYVENSTFAHNIFHTSAGGALILEYSNYNNQFFGNSFTSMAKEPIFYAQDSINGNMWNQSTGGNYWENYTNRYPMAQEVNDSGYYDTPYYFDYNTETSIVLGINEGDLMPLVECPFDLEAFGYVEEEIDNENPTWDQIPDDQEISFGDNVIYNVNASDNGGIVFYSINDTNQFNITSEGIITNKTNLVPGIYHLQITVQDASGNKVEKIITITYLEASKVDDTDDNSTPDDDPKNQRKGMVFLLILIAILYSLFEITFGMGFGMIAAPILILIGYSPQEMVVTVIFSQILGILVTTLLNYLLDKGKISLSSDEGIGLNWILKHPYSIKEKQSNSDANEDDKIKKWGLEKISRDTQLLFFILGSAMLSALVLSLINLGFAKYSGFTNVIKIYVAITIIAQGLMILIKKQKAPQFSLMDTALFGVIIGINKSLTGTGYDPITVSDRFIYGSSKDSANAISKVIKNLIGLSVLLYYAFASLIFSVSAYNGQLIWTFFVGLLIASPIALVIHRKLKKYKLNRYFGITMILMGIISFIVILIQI